jgi:hypothetical protein
LQVHVTVRVAALVEHVRPETVGSVVVDAHFAALPSVQVCTQPLASSVSQ